VDAGAAEVVATDAVVPGALVVVPGAPVVDPLAVSDPLAVPDALVVSGALDSVGVVPESNRLANGGSAVCTSDPDAAGF
jgi:hypothetical protein